MIFESFSPYGLFIWNASRPDNESSLDALIEALEALDNLCGVIEEKYTDASVR